MRKLVYEIERFERHSSLTTLVFPSFIAKWVNMNRTMYQFGLAIPRNCSLKGSGTRNKRTMMRIANGGSSSSTSAGPKRLDL